MELNIFKENKDLEDDVDEEYSLNLPDYDGRIIGWGVIFAVVSASLILYFR